MMRHFTQGLTLMPSRIARYIGSLAPLALLVTLAQDGRAQSPATLLARAANPAVFHAHLAYLADDLLEGRAPGTRGGELAAKYVAAQFERLGLEPAGDSGTYFHNVPIVGLSGLPVLKYGGTELRYPDDYVLWSMRDESDVRVSAPAVFVGYGIVAPEYRWDDYAGADVRGKIVLCLVNDPGLSDSTIFRGKILTYYGRWTYKIEEAERHGAAGILLIHTTESATYPWSTVVGSNTGEKVRLETAPGPLVVAGWIKDTAAAPIFAAAGHDLPQLMTKAATRGFQAVELPPLEASVVSSIRHTSTANVVGRLPGHGTLANQAVMIGGHYDHLGVRGPVNGDSIYNGAEDNASGTAAVMAAAEAFVKSGVKAGRSILFMAFGAEESGLLGSQAFAARPTLPLRDLAAVINLDEMNLYGKTRDVSALGTDQSSLGETFRSAAAAEGLRVTTNQGALISGSFFRSDHFPFARAGVPALSLENGQDYVGKTAEWGAAQRKQFTEERYHLPQDEMLPWFAMDGVVQQLRVVLRTALAVANATAQPVWAPTSEFRAAGEARRRQTGAGTTQ